MWTQAQQQRLDEISAELIPLVESKSISDAAYCRMKSLTDEGERLLTKKNTHQAALKWAGSADPIPYGGPTNGYGDRDNGIAFKGFGPGMENRIQPTSVYSMDREQIAALKQAAQQRMPFKVHVGSKGLEHGFMDGMRTKAALTEGGLNNALPPIQQPGPGGFWGLPYELTRVANFFPAAAMDGPGIAYFKHTANAAEAAYTAEGATKPDISPTVTETYVRPAKVAGRFLATHELVQDAGDAFAQMLVTELARSVYNAESNLLLNGTTGANGFAGINNVSGTLTTALDSANSESPLDTLSRAFVALRNDYFVPDRVFIHPSTLGAIRRLKDDNHRYQLDLLQGAGAISGTNEEETIFGVPCTQTTQQAAGTAAVLSVQSGAAVLYVREALTTFFDPYSQASSNIYQYIAETRIALATPRPTAINLVSGLPTS